MILNSYNLKYSLHMKKIKEQYKNSLSIVPINNMYTLTNDFIKKQKEYTEEIKEVEVGSNKKRKKKGLNLEDLDIDLPKLKDDDDIVIINKDDINDDDNEEGINVEIRDTIEDKEVSDEIILGPDKIVSEVEVSEEKEEQGEKEEINKVNDIKKGGGDIKTVVVTSFF